MRVLSSPYPLVLAPILMEKVWGGRRLERFGKKLQPGAMIGESWELADLASTSASGAGGGAARSTIVNGPLAGKTVHDALDAWGASLLGRARRTESGGLPLLIKFLDARENLSVQVHPSPAFASAHPDAHLKTECWIILDAEPDAVIYKGIRAGVDRATLQRHITEGTAVNDLVAVPAVVGECHNLPSGTCHALGAGVLVAEVQTPSDTTFRVYDWGRTGRELHISQALECIEFGPAPDATRLEAGRERGLLVETEFFRVERARTRAEFPGTDAMTALVVLDGKGTLTGPGGSVEVQRGNTALLPAACSAQCVIRPREDLDLLVVTCEPR